MPSWTAKGARATARMEVSLSFWGLKVESRELADNISEIHPTALEQQDAANKQAAEYEARRKAAQEAIQKQGEESKKAEEDDKTAEEELKAVEDAAQDFGSFPAITLIRSAKTPQETTSSGAEASTDEDTPT